MHEKAKEDLKKIGTSHNPGHEFHTEGGMHHQEFHEFEAKALEGKKHHREHL